MSRRHSSCRVLVHLGKSSPRWRGGGGGVERKEGGRERNKGAKPEKVSLVVADVSSEGLFFFFLSSL